MSACTSAGLTRRNVLSAGAVAAGSVVASPLIGSGCPAAAAAKPGPLAGPPVMKHAVGDPRGIDIAVVSGRNAEARYGLMFKSLPAHNPSDALLRSLAEKMVEARGPLDDVAHTDAENDNPDLPAGFTYLGQFIDHDMTLDHTPLSQQKVDPTALKNFDSPFFDLSSVYGRGPALDPQLYDPARPGQLLLVERDGVLDLPRKADGTAIIGDGRNDENLIVLQMHIAFIRLHNTLVTEGRTFEEARQQVRWHFQWIVVNDFLRRMVGDDVLPKLLVQGTDGKIKQRTSFYKPTNTLRPMMPIEYSVAAYRFGHSMIRAEYELRDTPDSSLTLPIFSPTGRDLRGSRPLPAEYALDWNYFFDIPDVENPDDRNMARLMDTQVARPLRDLPPTVVVPTAGAVLALAERNLLRAKRMGLPSGQDVARAMKLPVLSNAALGLTDPAWAGKAPLWFYILKEAELGGGRTLGPVGGRIVADVILGILAADKASYFNSPWFKPMETGWDMGRLLKRSGAWTEPEPEQPEDEAPDEAEPDAEELPEEEAPHDPEVEGEV